MNMAKLDPRKTIAIALAGLAGLGAALWLRPGDVAATPTEVPAPAPAEPLAAQASDAGVAAPEDTTTARIAVSVAPATGATVSWGKKRIGKILPGKSFVIVRPRDSGPLDLMVRAEGYLPVQTRAHTFSNHRLLVKLTPVDKKSELLGYRAPLDAGVDMADQAALNAVAGDAGVAAPPLAPAPATASPLLPSP